MQRNHRSRMRLGVYNRVLTFSIFPSTRAIAGTACTQQHDPQTTFSRGSLRLLELLQKISMRQGMCHSDMLNKKLVGARGFINHHYLDIGMSARGDATVRGTHAISGGRGSLNAEKDIEGFARIGETQVGGNWRLICAFYRRPSIFRDGLKTRSKYCQREVGCLVRTPKRRSCR